MNSTLLLLAAVAADPSAGARQQATVVMPTDARQRAYQQEVGYADAVVHHGVVYLSGVPAFLAPGETDPVIAYRRAFEAIGRTLARAGVGFDDVVSLTTYHLDPAAQIDAFAKVKADYIKGPPPAWSAIGTTALLQPGALVEITVTAHLPQKATP